MSKFNLPKIKLPEIKPYADCFRNFEICDKCNCKKKNSYVSIGKFCPLDYNIPLPYRSSMKVPLDCKFLTEHIVSKGEDDE